MSGLWVELRAEACDFEAWLGERCSVNAWVGIETNPAAKPFYGGWAVEGDALYYEWDESVMTTAEGDTPEEVIADLIRIARAYRRRVDEDRAEFEAEG